MCRFLKFSALLVLALPLSAHAQSSFGRIDGSVFDDDGTPFAQVTVTAVSPTQIGGLRVTETNRNGEFHLIGLMPGEFTSDHRELHQPVAVQL